MDDLNAELALAELERSWAARRSSLSQRLDAAVRGAVAGVLDAAAQLRQAMEQDAAGALERVRRERSAIALEVAQLRAQQAGLGAEIAPARQRAEREAAEIRRAAQSEREALLRDAERRRVELIDEIALLERQLAQLSSGVQTLLEEQIGRVRAGLPAAEQLGTPSQGVREPGPSEAVRLAGPRPSVATRPASAPATVAARPASPTPTVGSAAGPAAAARRPPSVAGPAWPSVDPAATSDPTVRSVDVGPPELAVDQGGSGLEVLDEGELFDLAASRVAERSFEEKLAELEIDAPGLGESEAFGDRLVPEADVRGGVPPAEAAVAPPDAELAALDAELALDPMEAPGPLAAVEETPTPATAADARRALLASLEGFELTPEEAEADEPFASRPTDRSLAQARLSGGRTVDASPAGASASAAAASATGQVAPAEPSPLVGRPARRAVPAEPPTRSATAAARAPGAAEPASDETARVEVAVTGTPSFACALELQRGIQHTVGVRQVRALQFERGTLVLSIEHDIGLDLAGAIQTLPGSLELIDRSGDRVELRFAGAT